MPRISTAAPNGTAPRTNSVSAPAAEAKNRGADAEDVEAIDPHPDEAGAEEMAELVADDHGGE
jgi:hypothetical protein